MLIKEEPVSPGVQGRAEGVQLGSCEVCAEPPVLPVAMVQSVLEGRGSNLGERRAKRPMLERYEMYIVQFISKLQIFTIYVKRLSDLRKCKNLVELMCVC